MQRLVRNSKYADCNKTLLQHIQNAYNGLRKGAKHRIVPLGKLQFICVSVGLKQELEAQNYHQYLAFNTR